jgi:fucose 4-O-acetylase-like acetyltransferase
MQSVNTSVAEPQQRLRYFDSIRGFSMILVVVSHVLIRMGIGEYDSVLGSIIRTFNLPLFFFISGFFAYRALERWNSAMVANTLRRKICSQIVCPILFFALTAYIENHDCFGWIHYGFGGYWFTIVLFQIYVIYLLSTLLARLLKKHWLVDVVMVTMSLVLLGVLIFFRCDSQLWHVLSYNSFTKFFQFFTFGMLAKKYFTKFSEFISTDIVKTVIILSYIGFLILSFCEGFNTRFPIAYQAVHDILVRYAGLLIVFIMFFNHKAYFEGDSKACVCLRFIGRRTLDIYMIHYLLLPNIQYMQAYLSDGNLIVFQLFISLAVSAIIIAISLVLSQVLRSSKYLSSILFGKAN